LIRSQPEIDVAGGRQVGIVIPIQQLEALGNELRGQRQRVVFTNGHFDLLHVGHLRYLQAARALGDVLVVGVNDDVVTTERKGPGRPIVPEGERAELLAGLACVDYVTIFHEPTAERAVALLRPDIYVKGGDYGPGRTELPEARIVAEDGGETVILPLERGRSTSAIVAAIRAGVPLT
jgi:D-glycero-beta-D-manno-heptose 1-phosphate adenylyltransferase